MTFSFNDAYRLINNVINEKIDQKIKSGAGIDVTWGTIASNDGEGFYSVYLYGDTVASTGFLAENAQAFIIGEPVRVSIDRRGNRWIDAKLTKLHPYGINRISSISATDPISSYPDGVSVFTTDATTGDLGFPGSVGQVITWKAGVFRVRQEFTRHSGTSGETFQRWYHDESGWSNWHRHTQKMRFVSLGQEYVPYNSATLVGTGQGAVDKTVELTNIPASDSQVDVMAVGRLLARHSAPSASSTYASLRHWGSSAHAATVYGITANNWAGLQYTVLLGGTNGRQIDMEVLPGPSGTLTYHLSYTGYWTNG